MPHIPYYPVEKLTDPELRGYMEHAATYGTPRPESQAIRAHVPAILRSFSKNWDVAFRNGVWTTRSRSSAGSTSPRPSTATTEALNGLSGAESKG